MDGITRAVLLRRVEMLSSLEKSFASLLAVVNADKSPLMVSDVGDLGISYISRIRIRYDSTQQKNEVELH